MSLLTRLTWFLAAVAMATGIIENRRLSCSCFLKNNSYRQVAISCGTETSNSEPPTRNVACDKETLGWVRPGYRFFPGLPALYKLYRTRKTYTGAVEACRRDGGHLAVPTNRQEAEAIGSLLAEDHPKVILALLGINDLAVKDNYVTVTGEAATYLPWVPGEPDHYVIGTDQEDCVTINKDGAFRDNMCSYVDNYVCQRDLNPVPPEDYRFIHPHGFFKLYATKSNFQAARKRCKQDGGHLAVIDTQEEADQLMKFYNVNDVGKAYVGLSDMDVEGSFVSETGKPADALNFDNWGPGEPNGDTREDCVTFSDIGMLSDISCDRKEAFFCELPLPS